MVVGCAAYPGVISQEQDNVKRPNSFLTLPPALLLCTTLGMAATPSHAQNIVPAKVQSDEQVTVWVNNAPLKTFVSQLATITGRKAYVIGELEGTVSGRFNGSMAETLSTVGEAYPVLFELDENSLAAVSDSEKSEATIALNETVDEQAMQSTLSADLLPGNDVQVGNGEVVVSGHPEFVRRMSASVASYIDGSYSAETTADAESDTNSDADTGVEVAQSGVVDNNDNSVLNADPVVDVATSQMINNDSKDVSAVNQSETVSRKIRSVTDIPGFNTF